jgi:hypothetical protein
MRKTELSKPWAAFPLQVSAGIDFSVAVIMEVGDGTNTLFWQDRWLSRQRISDIAPLVAAIIPKKIANKRRVVEALTEWRWVSDVHGAATVQVILEILNLCNLLSGVTLQPNSLDKHIWRSSSSGLNNNQQQSSLLVPSKLG